MRWCQRSGAQALVDDKGKPVGHHSGHRTLLRIGPGDERTYQCFATFDLPNGLLMSPR